MYHVGINLHRRYLVAEVVDNQGQRVAGARLPNDGERVVEFLDDLGAPSRVTFESTGNWSWLYDLLEGEGIETKLAHPQKVKAIASAKLKNDKVDSRILAQLLRTDLLPESYVPPVEIREWRELVRYRAALVRMKTALKNRIWALLGKRNIDLDSRSLMSRSARAELKALRLTPLARQVIEQLERSARSIVFPRPASWPAMPGWSRSRAAREAIPIMVGSPSRDRSGCAGR